MPSRERLNQETIPGGKNSPSPGCRVISKIGLQPGELHVQVVKSWCGSQSGCHGQEEFKVIGSMGCFTDAYE